MPLFRANDEDYKYAFPDLKHQLNVHLVVHYNNFYNKQNAHSLYCKMINHHMNVLSLNYSYYYNIQNYS